MLWDIWANASRYLTLLVQGICPSNSFCRITHRIASFQIATTTSGNTFSYLIPVYIELLHFIFHLLNCFRPHFWKSYIPNPHHNLCESSVPFCITLVIPKRMIRYQNQLHRRLQDPGQESRHLWNPCSWPLQKTATLGWPGIVIMILTTYIIVMRAPSGSHQRHRHTFPLLTLSSVMLSPPRPCQKSNPVITQVVEGNRCGGLGVWAGDKFWVPRLVIPPCLVIPSYPTIC